MNWFLQWFRVRLSTCSTYTYEYAVKVTVMRLMSGGDWTSNAPSWRTCPSDRALVIQVMNYVVHLEQSANLESASECARDRSLDYRVLQHYALCVWMYDDRQASARISRRRAHWRLTDACFRDLSTARYPVRCPQSRTRWPLGISILHIQVHAHRCDSLITLQRAECKSMRWQRPAKSTSRVESNRIESNRSARVQRVRTSRRRLEFRAALNSSVRVIDTSWQRVDTAWIRRTHLWTQTIRHTLIRILTWTSLVYDADVMLLGTCWIECFSHRIQLFHFLSTSIVSNSWKCFLQRMNNLLFWSFSVLNCYTCQLQFNTLISNSAHCTAVSTSHKPHHSAAARRNPS